MFEQILKAAIGMICVMGVWLLVQSLWRLLSGAMPNQDALGGRVGCHSCDCKTPCENSKTNAQ
ncbi:hypothetical protein Q31b_24740 [Novipirellula aureliae]|uniref:Uncharacterized protein n=1 Tax=Novipirellula aureliae TaxID=2527966 RepID=A0A5C6E4L4_9BACT|nr:hypothetical protein [Novipirellula aureliae]TWU43434.1 hypothetical protein Q31b_24740 [Novipirellula aureliae]